MTESLLLVIFAIGITLAIWGIRRLVTARKLSPLSKRTEAAIRLLLTLLAAFVAHALYNSGAGRLSYWIAVAANCLILYAISHLADRFILKD